MTSQDFVRLALQIATMLAFGLAFGQVMRRFRQPAVLGEMIGGIILGPTIFGLALPGLYLWLFQSSPNAAVVRDASIKLGMLFFLFVAGLEIDFSQMRQIGRKALLIGSVGTLVPIAAGVGLVYAIPRDFWGPAVQEHFFAFALFIGMNLANSANPVLARILMDLGLLRATDREHVDGRHDRRRPDQLDAVRHHPQRHRSFGERSCPQPAGQHRPRAADVRRHPRNRPLAGTSVRCGGSSATSPGRAVSSE